MPELKVYNRRPFQRLPVKCSPSKISENEARQKKKKQTLAFTTIALLFVFCSFNGYWIFTEIQESNRKARIKDKAQKSSSTVKAKKPKKKPWSFGSFYASVAGRSNSSENQLTPETIKEVENQMSQIAKLLPQIAKEKTTESTFKERFQFFARFYESLSEGDQKAIYPLVTPDKLKDLFNEDSAEAAKLLDRLLKRVQSLLP